MRLAFVLLLATLSVTAAGGCRLFNMGGRGDGTMVGGLGQGRPLAALRERQAGCSPHCQGGCGKGGCGIVGRLFHRGGEGCGHCGPLSRLHGRQLAAQQEQVYPAGPPTAAYAYPYYTLRGPRDFLQDNPMSIGPY